MLDPWGGSCRGAFGARGMCVARPSPASQDFENKFNYLHHEEGAATEPSYEAQKIAKGRKQGERAAPFVHEVFENILELLRGH